MPEAEKKNIILERGKVYKDFMFCSLYKKEWFMLC